MSPTAKIKYTHRRFSANTKHFNTDKLNYIYGIGTKMRSFYAPYCQTREKYTKYISTQWSLACKRSSRIQICIRNDFRDDPIEWKINRSVIINTFTQVWPVLYKCVCVCTLFFPDLIYFWTVPKHSVHNVVVPVVVTMAAAFCKNARLVCL